MAAPADGVAPRCPVLREPAWRRPVLPEFAELPGAGLGAAVVPAARSADAAAAGAPGLVQEQAQVQAAADAVAAALFPRVREFPGASAGAVAASAVWQLRSRGRSTLRPKADARHCRAGPGPACGANRPAAHPGPTAEGRGCGIPAVESHGRYRPAGQGRTGGPRGRRSEAGRVRRSRPVRRSRRGQAKGNPWQNPEHCRCAFPTIRTSVAGRQSRVTPFCRRPLAKGPFRIAPGDRRVARGAVCGRSRIGYRRVKQVFEFDRVTVRDHLALSSAQRFPIGGAVSRR